MANQFEITNPDFQASWFERPDWELPQIQGFTDVSSIVASASHLVTSGSQSPIWTAEEIRTLREIIGVLGQEN